MKWETVAGDGFLLVRVAQKTLVKRPEWGDLDLADDPPSALVVLDLAQPEFISSLFWEGCRDWARELVRSGRTLALLHLDETQQPMLNLVPDLDQVPVFGSCREVQEYVLRQHPLHPHVAGRGREGAR